MDRAKQAVLNALTGVIDPEVGLDIVTMGLVYWVETTETEVRLLLTLTTQGCPMGESILGMAYDAAQSAVPDKKLDMRLSWTPAWDPRMIEESARRALGAPL